MKVHSEDLKNVQVDSSNSKTKKVLTYLTNFCNNTSIHGFRYLAESRRPVSEKIWWLVILCGCFYMCGNLIASTLKRRDENPIFTSSSLNPGYLWDVPFPAVTICSEIKIKKSMYDVNNHIAKIREKNITDEEKNRVLGVMLFCELPLPRYKHTAVDLQTLDYILAHAPTMKEVIWHALPFKYLDLFSPTLTNFGLCYSFNMLDKNELFTEVTYLHKNHSIHRKSSHWNIDKNYDEIQNATIPQRASEFTKFQLFLKAKGADVNGFCNLMLGFKLILHHPAEFPTLAPSYIPISVDSTHNIWIKPELTITSQKLESYEPSKRSCVYSHERRLKFFKIYTKHNCKLECIANSTLEQCNCIPYYLPHEQGTKICGMRQQKCMELAKEKAFKMVKSKENRKIFRECNCLPLCTSITYHTENYEARNFADPRLENRSQINFMFKDEELQVMERQELFSNSDFWASCGGLLGLFTGFSVVSLAEIIYFSTIRWIHDFWRAGKGKCCRNKESGKRNVNEKE
ncbi:pickpocket protein 28-like [Zophobas morio]|uniref:pickpocket protein 28-like n=1 Tax=Zophobas morio TaxID=2755281 RepID=UPI003083A4EB